MNQVQRKLVRLTLTSSLLCVDKYCGQIFLSFSVHLKPKMKTGNASFNVSNVTKEDVYNIIMSVNVLGKGRFAALHSSRPYPSVVPCFMLRSVDTFCIIPARVEGPTFHVNAVCCDCYQFCQKMEYGLLENDFVCLTSDSLTTPDRSKPFFICCLFYFVTSRYDTL